MPLYWYSIMFALTVKVLTSGLFVWLPSLCHERRWCYDALSNPGVYTIEKLF